MAQETQQKEFAPGVFLKRQSFGKGKGEIIKQSFNWADFKAWAEKNVTESGYLNLDIKTSINDKDKLYAELNTWVPAPKEEDEDEDGDNAPF